MNVFLVVGFGGSVGVISSYGVWGNCEWVGEECWVGDFGEWCVKYCDWCCGGCFWELERKVLVDCNWFWILYVGDLFNDWEREREREEDFIIGNNCF